MTTAMSKELSESYVTSLRTPDDTFKTISDCLKHHASAQPNKNAYVFVSADGSREVVTWKQLYENSVAAARGFIQLGVKRHDFVAVNVRSGPEWLYINFGIILAGARAANISFTYTDGSDIVAMMEKLATCSTMVLDAGVDDDNWNIFKKLLDDHTIDGTVKSVAMPHLNYLVMLDRPMNTPDLKTFNDILTDASSDVALPVLQEDDVITLFQTSGSTGLPKVVTHTHTSLLAYSSSLHTYIIENKSMDMLNVRADEEESGNTFDPSDHVLYSDRPFPWIGGWPSNVHSGMTRVTRPGIGADPEDIIAFMFEVIKRERCDFLIVLPHVLHAMRERKAEIGAEWPLKYIGTGAQPTTKDVARSVGSLCMRLVNMYGGTEFGLASGIMVHDINEFEDHSCGYPFPGYEIKIVDNDEKIVPVGVSGEVYLRSIYMFKKYWNDPQKTESVLTGDGWYKTDDIGHMSKEGVLYVEGRKSDMIISGGMNVNPAILESAIETCPDVNGVIVVPVPHPQLYQVLCACVIPEAGCDVTVESLRVYCESIHNDKPGIFTVLPKYYLIFEKFPRTSTGKISRKELAITADKLLKKL